MKHLKRINELKSKTYASAAVKLKQMGHIRRSGELENWSKEAQNKEKDARELENFNSFKHDIPFKINLVRVRWNASNKSRDHEIIMTGNFYLKPSFDDYWARDQYRDNFSDGVAGYSYYMPFEVGIMPADEETKDKFRSIDDKLSDEVYEGVYWLQRLNYKIIDEGSKEINPTGEFHWECKENDAIMFESRSEALRFKKMFVDAVNGRNTFGNSKWVPNMYEQLKKFFMGEWLDGTPSDNKKQPETFNEEAFKRFLESTNKMSINQLYRN
jgi:hypothetical protein